MRSLSRWRRKIKLRKFVDASPDPGTLSSSALCSENGQTSDTALAALIIVRGSELDSLLIRNLSEIVRLSNPGIVRTSNPEASEEESSQSETLHWLLSPLFRLTLWQTT